MEDTTASVASTTATLGPMTSTALADDTTTLDYLVTIGGWMYIIHDMDYVSKISFISILCGQIGRASCRERV